MAEITITNSQGAIMRSNGGTPQAWDTAHDLTTAGYIDSAGNLSSTGMTIGAYYSGYGGGTYAIFRVFLDFDLSGITAGSTINSAKLKLYGRTAASPHPSVTVVESDFIVLKGTFTDGSTLATSMFDEFEGFQAGWDGTDSGIVEYSGEEASSWSTSGYNEVTLNADCRSDIASRAGGSTRLAMVIMNHDHDYHDDPNGHDGNSLSFTYDRYVINFNFDPAESNPPQLVVDYTEAAADPAPSPTRVIVNSGNLNINGGSLKVNK